MSFVTSWMTKGELRSACAVRRTARGNPVGFVPRIHPMNFASAGPVLCRISSGGRSFPAWRCNSSVHDVLEPTGSRLENLDRAMRVGAGVGVRRGR